jgi:dephospho-CoA kinase
MDEQAKAIPHPVQQGEADAANLQAEMFIDLDAATDRFFSEDSLALGGPKIVILAGGMCAGKTTIRREKYEVGYVVLDAAEIFRSLYPEEGYVFSAQFDDVVNLVGSIVAARAIKEHRNIVTEMIGADSDEMMTVIESMKQAGYQVDAVLVDCDEETAWKRHEQRNDDSLSSFYPETYHQRWLLTAAKEYPRLF